jgi:hypothetical protein
MRDSFWRSYHTVIMLRIGRPVFAKGLGKPVIYMYNKKIGNRETPRFDVGSDLVIFWEEGQPEKAAQSLKDIIRNMLFGEANQNDDSMR